MIRTLLLALPLLAVAAACTSDDDNGTGNSPTASATAEGTATGTSTTRALAVGDILYLDSDSTGVALRDGCDDDARLGGAWPAGLEVRVMQVGSGDCDGWSLVFAGTGTWVRNEALTTEAPAQTVARPTASPTATTSSGSGASGGGSTSGGSTSGGSSGSSGTTGSGGTTSTPPPVPTAPPSSINELRIKTQGGGEVLLSTILGQARLRGGENGFAPLGIVSNSRTVPDSICNPSGRYGSTGSDTSIRNRNSPYGSPSGGAITDPNFNSRISAYNSSATDPPRLMLNDDLLAWVTTNPGITPRVDPDTLFFSLGC